MFSAPIDRLRVEIKAVRYVVELHEYSRELFYSAPAGIEGEAKSEDLWRAVRERDPGKFAWLVYDHCAALLRLYAVYSIFIEDLVSDYLVFLPGLYETYDQLPESVLRQHRAGFGQILLRLGDAGRYRHLREGDIILQLSQGLGGAQPYSLLKDAFFVDRQNYRTDALTRLFGSLGVENVCERIAKHPSMRAFLAERIGNATTFDSELDGFVKLRNEAAHSPVDEVIATSQFLTAAEFVLLTCEILTEIVSREALLRKAKRRPGPTLGVVEHVYRAGMVAIIGMVPETLTVGDDVALVYMDRVRVARIVSIHENDVPKDTLTAVDGQKVGVGLDQKCRVGEVLRRLTIEPSASTAQVGVLAAKLASEEGHEHGFQEDVEPAEGLVAIDSESPDDIDS